MDDLLSPHAIKSFLNEMSSDPAPAEAGSEESSSSSSEAPPEDGSSTSSSGVPATAELESSLVVLVTGALDQLVKTPTLPRR